MQDVALDLVYEKVALSQSSEFLSVHNVVGAQAWVTAQRIAPAITAAAVCSVPRAMKSNLRVQQPLRLIYTVSVLLSSACGANSSNECGVSEAAKLSDTKLAAVDHAHRLAGLARQLEDTQKRLRDNQAHFLGSSTHTSGFKYSTFIYGMLLAWALAAAAAFLGWEYLQHHLQRKQQSAVIGGLKDMDDSTLKRVLGKVPHALDAPHLQTDMLTDAAQGACIGPAEQSITHVAYRDNSHNRCRCL